MSGLVTIHCFDSHLFFPSFPLSLFLSYFRALSSQPSGKGRRLPEVYCIVSRLGCFDLFSKVEEKPHKYKSGLNKKTKKLMRKSTQ